jgi:alpha-amylase
MLQADPYLFSRILDGPAGDDRVLVAMDQPVGAKTIPVFRVFADGAVLLDSYSGTRATVIGGSVSLDTPFTMVLLGEAS